MIILLIVVSEWGLFGEFEDGELKNDLFVFIFFNIMSVCFLGRYVYNRKIFLRFIWVSFVIISDVFIYCC